MKILLDIDNWPGKIVEMDSPPHVGEFIQIGFQKPVVYIVKRVSHEFGIGSGMQPYYAHTKVKLEVI